MKHLSEQELQTIHLAMVQAIAAIYKAIADGIIEYADAKEDLEEFRNVIFLIRERIKSV